jgi:hypothetical protein
MLTLGVLLTGLLIGSALAAGIGGLEGSALEPITDFAAAVFALTAAIGAITVIILSWRLFRLTRPSKRDLLDRL